MTEQTTGPDDVRPQTLLRMHAIATALKQAGLEAAVHDTQGVLDIRATLNRAEGKATDVNLDEDGYVTVNYWNDPEATTVQVIEVISRVLAAITG